MTIELPKTTHATRTDTGRGAMDGPPHEFPLTYRGVDIRIQVQRTPDYVFGHADLVDGDRYWGRLSIGNPRATSEEVQRRLAALAQARVDVLRSVHRDTGGAGP